MTSPNNVARARRFIAGLWLASVACMASSQPLQVGPSTAPSDGPALALILPDQTTVFADAAEAVRQGFFAAHAAGGKRYAIQVIEIADDPIGLLAAVDGARQRGVKAVVGPLPRADVNALVDAGMAGVPVVALNYPERDAAAPSSLIALGLSAEAEAHQVVRLALSEFLGTRRAPAASARFVVLAGSGPLERRIAQAYVSALRSAGEPPLLVESASGSGERLAKLLDPVRHEAVFLALDAREAALIRARIPRPLLIFGTSLLNAGTASPEAIALAHDLDGIRFVDMPWLLKAEAGASEALLPATPLPPERARLFALGVDAFRVALRWSGGETRFALEGLTGRLTVDRADGPRVDRKAAGAIYRNGAIERDEFVR